ncbi:hypothetical protein NDU88_006165 [Pleurodeles waltl]|uniref:Uncharacterized protein n=1 Tax=Pleurodeles waltl TaxID=8319 RepID=A0AAV7PKQ6_PLEWA|nr:hypothetical protein NDU88_006165 [Pleurodeles waltl]
MCLNQLNVLRALSALSAARIETRLWVSYPAAPALEMAAGEMGRGVCCDPESEPRLSPRSAIGLPCSRHVAPQRP